MLTEISQQSTKRSDAIVSDHVFVPKIPTYIFFGGGWGAAARQSVVVPTRTEPASQVEVAAGARAGVRSVAQPTAGGRGRVDGGCTPSCPQTTLPCCSCGHGRNIFPLSYVQFGNASH